MSGICVILLLNVSGPKDVKKNPVNFLAVILEYIHLVFLQIVKIFPVGILFCLLLTDNSQILERYLVYLWNSQGKNAGVGSQSLLQEIFPTQGSNPGLPHCRQVLYQLNHQGKAYICMHAKLLQSCPTLCNAMDHSLPNFSVHGILQARILTSRWPCPPPGDLPDPEIKPETPALAGKFCTASTGKLTHTQTHPLLIC